MKLNFFSKSKIQLPQIYARNDAFLVPPSSKDKRGHVYWSGGGLFLENGRPDECLKSHMQGVPDLRAEIRESAALNQGPALFCGILKDHFGHFFCESIGRLWALEELGSEIPLVYLHRGKRSNPNEGTPKAFFELFGVNNPKISIWHPTKFENIWNATDLFRPLQNEGIHPKLRNWLTSRLPSKSSKFGPDLYVSRKGLKIENGGLLCENLVELGLESQGYTIFRPEEHDLSEQIAAYRDAERIVVNESGSLHMMSIFANAKAKVAIIQRRPRVIGSIDATQKAFLTPDFRFVMSLTAFWSATDSGRSMGWLGVGEIDFVHLWRELEYFGFVSSTENMPVPTESEIAAERQEKVANRSTRVALTPDKHRYISHFLGSLLGRMSEDRAS